MIPIIRRLAALERLIVHLVKHKEDAERRIQNLVRMGRVVDTDPAKGLVKIAWAKDADDNEVEGPWMPWATRAGNIKIWAPPSKGEQVMIFSPSGEIGTASYVMPGGYSDQFPANHDKDDEFRLSVGDNTVMTVTNGGIVTATPSVRTESGRIEYINDGSGGAKPGVPMAGGTIS